jgi:hypothetical protein
MGLNLHIAFEVAIDDLLAGTGASEGNSPTFKITMKEYEDMVIKVGRFK